MAKPKGRPKTKGPDSPPRLTAINLKASQDYVDWLDSIHRKTHLPKAVIVRLALDLWATSNGHPTSPRSDDDR